MPIVWTCKFNRTWIIKQPLQYKWSNKVTYGLPRKAMVQLRSWMIPGLAWEHSSPWRVPVEKQQQHSRGKTLPSWPCGLRRRVNSTYNSGMLLYEKIPRSNTHVNKRNYILKRNSCVCMYLLFPEIRSSWKWNRWRYSQLSAGISQWSEKWHVQFQL